MKLMTTMCVLALGLAVSLAAQAARPADDHKAILGRWIGTVTADVGEMPFALELKEVDGRITGKLETMHGDWSVTSATVKSGKWTLAVSAEDGTGGKLVGQVKDATFAGDWDFAPRAVGTFELTKAKKQGDPRRAAHE